MLIVMPSKGEVASLLGMMGPSTACSWKLWRGPVSSMRMIFLKGAFCRSEWHQQPWFHLGTPAEEVSMYIMGNINAEDEGGKSNVNLMSSNSISLGLGEQVDRSKHLHGSNLWSPHALYVSHTQQTCVHCQKKHRTTAIRLR